MTEQWKPRVMRDGGVGGRMWWSDRSALLESRRATASPQELASLDWRIDTARKWASWHGEIPKRDQ